MGLWLPDSPLPQPGLPDEANQARDGLGEWYVLISDRPGGTPSANFNAFAPTPLGNDLFARAGASGSKPVFGNFDPPPHGGTGGSGGTGGTGTDGTGGTGTGGTGGNETGSGGTGGTGTGGSETGTGGTGGTGSGGTGMTNPSQRLDTNVDGFVTPLDVLLVVNALNQVGPGPLPATLADQPRFTAPRAYLDANHDGSLTAIDALVIINHLNSAATGEGEGEGALLTTVAYAGRAEPAGGTELNEEHPILILPGCRAARAPLSRQNVSSSESEREPVAEVSGIPAAEASSVSQAARPLGADVFENLEDLLSVLVDDVEECHRSEEVLDQLFRDW